MILALFFTRSVSLETWIETGLFDREKLIYEKHLNKGNFRKIFWLTYGSGDTELARQLKTTGKLHPGIDVISMPGAFNTKIGKLLYTFLLPLVHKATLRQADVYKTNQMDGSWSAVLAKCLFKRPLVARTGYTLSTFAERLQSSRIRTNIYRSIEWLAYKAATRAIVASQQDQRFIFNRYGYSPRKTSILPNYIDTDAFKPLQAEKRKNRIIFVGRLNLEKNIFNLITAIAKTDFALDVYGQGELKEKLRRHAENLGARVNFLGVVPNSELPQLLNTYLYYILPSHFEGMPKTLLEAMACGCVCIGSDVSGINEVIENGVNGFLAGGTDAESLYHAILEAVGGNHALVARQAALTIQARFSLEAIVESDLAVYQQVA